MNRETIYLAALLHDIGKFWQRADDRMAKSKDINLVTQNLSGYMCPIKENGVFGYQHVAWTHQFFDTHQGIFNSVVDKNTGEFAFRINPFSKGNHQDNLVNLAIFHHYPATRYQAIIQLADWWSSGIDRREANMETEQENPGTPLSYGAAKFKKVPLHSLFSEITTNKRKGERTAYHLAPLNPKDANCFYANKFGENDIKDLTPEYNKLWSLFSNELSKLPVNSVDGFSESLLFLLKKYTWSIPSSTNDMAHVSLFEHLKSTAAFADCLFTYHEQYPDHFDFDDQKKRLSVKEGYCPVLMLCGDISGIQNFIYNVASAKASVSLKGRSFYLQLIIETVIQHLIKETGTAAGHIVYSSGGKFYMVLPNTPETVEKLKSAREKLISMLWEEQKMKLYLCLDWIPFNYQTGQKFEDARIFSTEKSSDGVAIESLNQLWKAVSDKATAQKGQKYQQLLLQKYHHFFGQHGKGIDVGKKDEVCAVTGEESPDLVQLDERDIESIKVLKIVKKQVELGKTLKDADIILTHKFGEIKENAAMRGAAVKVNPLSLNYHQYLFDEIELTKTDAEFRSISSADTSRVRILNNTDFLWSHKLKGQQVSYGFLFYGGNKQAKNVATNEVKTFYELARNNDNEPTYLGVLRMDIDGLGLIFQQGIPEHLRTFAAYSTLSTALDYFFSGKLNELRDNPAFSEWVNIIYSGGDDLFVVGRWAEVIDFAKMVRDEFRKFTGGREDISISGGITFMDEKFPISLGATQAGEAEFKAKSYKNVLLKEFMSNSNIPDQKNCICLFGEPVSWAWEYEWVKKKKEKFIKLYKIDGTITKGFLHKLIDLKLHKDYMLQMQEQKHREVKNDYSYRWNAAYYLARYLKRFDAKKATHFETIQLIDELKNNLFDQQIGNDRYFDLIAVAARWAEFHIKEKITK